MANQPFYPPPPHLNLLVPTPPPTPSPTHVLPPLPNPLASVAFHVSSFILCILTNSWCGNTFLSCQQSTVHRSRRLWDYLLESISRTGSFASEVCFRSVSHLIFKSCSINRGGRIRATLSTCVILTSLFFLVLAADSTGSRVGPQIKKQVILLIVTDELCRFPCRVPED